MAAEYAQQVRTDDEEQSEWSAADDAVQSDEKHAEMLLGHETHAVKTHDEMALVHETHGTHAHALQAQQVATQLAVLVAAVVSMKKQVQHMV